MERINWISRCKTLCWIFWKKFIEKIKYSRSSPGHKISRCDQQPYNFFSVFADFRTLLGNSEKPNRSIRRRKISCNWGKIFYWLSQKERFLEPIEKILRCDYWWAGVSTMSIALFWWSRTFICFFFFILLQFCYW